MKFCGNCGKQLEDGSIFCGECGAKQEIFGAEKIAHDDLILPDTSDTATPKVAMRFEITDWLVVVLLIIAYPLILLELILDLLLIIPNILWWILFVGFQALALCLMWSRKKWNIWAKTMITVLYVLAYFV